MCGLYGIIFHRNPQTLSTNQLQTLCNNLAVLSADRGIDATGVAQIWRTGAVNMYKRTVPSYEIIQHELWKAVTGLWYPDSVALMGHTRRRTMGDNTKEYAHPHISISKKYGLLIGTHNGSVYNHSYLPRAHRQTSLNDSANLITALSDEPEHLWPTVLSRANGSIALALSRQGYTYLTRNTESPLVLATMNNGSFTVYASTEHILHSALVLANFLEYQIHVVASNKLYKWTPDLHEPIITDCAYRAGYAVYGTAAYGYSADVTEMCDSCGSYYDVQDIWENNGLHARCSKCRSQLRLTSGTSQ